MFNTLGTYLQLFGIGFTLGMAGPCLLACGPILVSFVAASRKRFSEALPDIIVFSFGRLFAYIILGALAGLSGGLLRQFTSSGPALFFKPAAGLISIALGIFVLVNSKAFSDGCQPHNRFNTYSIAGLFALGFMTGLAPCAPLLALLLQIALMSKTGLEGASYALFFGLGTFISCLIVVGGISGIIAWLPSKLFKSKTSNLIYRITCALLLILLGLSLILKTLFAYRA